MSEQEGNLRGDPVTPGNGGSIPGAYGNSSSKPPLTAAEFDEKYPHIYPSSKIPSQPPLPPAEFEDEFHPKAPRTKVPLPPMGKFSTQNPPPPPKPTARFKATDDVNFGIHTPITAPRFIPASWASTITPQPPPPPQRFMPYPDERGAPRFDGDPLLLKRFLERVESLARTCQISSKETIEHTLGYLNSRDYRTWKSRPSAQGSSWQAFKRDILAMYPEADEDRMCTRRDLELLTDRQSRTPMTSRFQYGEYYREFITMSDTLLDIGDIGTC